MGQNIFNLALRFILEIIALIAYLQRLGVDIKSENKAGL